MISSVINYFATLGDGFGRGWNRFWFTPSDPLTLGLLRIATGLMAFYLVASYSPDLERYFGRGGLVPLEMVQGLEQTLQERAREGGVHLLPGQVREAMPREYRFSYLDYVHTAGGLRTVHACGLLTLALFTCGLFTRVAAVASLVVVLSYLHRGPMLTSQVEPILAFVMFYLCLGPAGAACSLDRRRAARRNGPAATASLASPWATVSLRLIQVHLTVVYAMMAVGKIGGGVWWNGTAMWFLIARSEQRMVDLTALHSLPLLVHAWSYAVMFWQAAFPVLIWNRLARPLVLGVNALMWALLAPVIGNIPLAVMMVVASIAFIPGDVLRKVTPGPAGRYGDYQAAVKAEAAA